MAPQGLVRPLEPGFLVEMGLDRSIQGVIFHPRIPTCKLPHRLGRLTADPGEGQTQQRIPVMVQRSIINGIRRCHPGALQLGLGQKALRRQLLQIQKQGVSRKGGLTGIGGVPRPGGAHGQNLPPALAGSSQEIRKGTGLAAQRPDAVRGRQGEDRQ